MRRYRFTPILVLLLTAALMLTACGNPSPGGQSAPQSSDSSGAAVKVPVRQKPLRHKSVKSPRQEKQLKALPLRRQLR